MRRYLLDYTQLLTLAQHAIEERERGACIPAACREAARLFEPERETR